MKHDELWDGWMKALSESYARTFDLLKAGKTSDAAKEFASKFSTTVDDLYSKAAQTYPVRFSKMTDWCTWADQLVAKTKEARAALDTGQSEEAMKKMELLRRHFYAMHVEAKTLKANDYIYAFRTIAGGAKPDAEKLGALVGYVQKAEPSFNAKAQAPDYAQAMKAWSACVEPILKEKKIGDGQIKPLRDATETLYRAYGIQFE